MLLLRCVALLALLLATGPQQTIGLVVRSPSTRLSLGSRARHPRNSATRVNSLVDELLLPLCLQASSKTTTVNDPTAGMSTEEITNYMSNVGGGLCGAPDFVRVAIGFGLNLSLIVFGLFTISYVVLGGLNFALEKQVDELVDEVQVGGKSFKSIGDVAADAWNAPINTPPNPAGKASREGSGGASRETRRLQARIGKSDKDKKE